MRWNPYLSGAGASVYVVAVVLLIHAIGAFRANTPDTILDPIGALSLLVFSVAVMGFVFFYQPAVLLTENKRSEALTHFVKTLTGFAGVTLVILVTLTLAHVA